MAKRSAGERKSEFIARARLAIDRGVSRAAFLRRARAENFSVRRTIMLSEWRNLTGLEAKKDLLKYVRKDYYPSPKVIANVSWKLSKEFMYVAKVKSRLQPDQPLTERNVNIVSDVPMTPRMVEQAIVEQWAEWEKYMKETIEKITPFTAVRRVME